MKRPVKEILNDMKTFGFKWKKDPITIYKELKDSSTDDITLNKKDLEKIFKFLFLRDFNHTNIINSLNKQLYGP